MSSVQVNFRAGSVRQSLWIKQAAPALTFTIVVNYSEFFPRRFTPTAVAAFRPCPPLLPPAALAASLLHYVFFSFYLSVSRPFLLLPSRSACILLHSKDARHRRVHRTSCSSCLLNRLDARLNYTRHHGFDAYVSFYVIYVFFKRFVMLRVQQVVLNQE